VDLPGELVRAPDDVDIPTRLVAGDLGQEVVQRPHMRASRLTRGAPRRACSRPIPSFGRGRLGELVVYRPAAAFTTAFLAPRWRDWLQFSQSTMIGAATKTEE